MRLDKGYLIFQDTKNAPNKAKYTLIKYCCKCLKNNLQGTKIFHQLQDTKLLRVPLERMTSHDLATLGLEGQYSSQLSYIRIISLD